MTAGMPSVNDERGSATPRPVSALPSVQARALAFGAIIVAGACGGLIGYSAVKVSCQIRTTADTVARAKNCSTPEGVGGVTGAVIAAVGVAVIAVLVLRAMGEWRSIKEKRQLEQLIEAASAAVHGGPGRLPPPLSPTLGGSLPRRPSDPPAAACHPAADHPAACLPPRHPPPAPAIRASPSLPGAAGTTCRARARSTKGRFRPLTGSSGLLTEQQPAETLGVFHAGPPATRLGPLTHHRP